MKHSITEIYKIVGDETHNYSAKAVEFINHVEKWKNRKEGDCYSLWYKTSGNKNNTFRIYDEIGNKNNYRLAYLYGSYTWFDTEEERAAYRAEVAKEAEEKRNKKIRTVNLWKSPYTGEIIAIPADFLPNNQKWELVDTIERNAE